jgi:hypothetical protein
MIAARIGQQPGPVDGKESGSVELLLLRLRGLSCFDDSPPESGQCVRRVYPHGHYSPLGQFDRA